MSASGTLTSRFVPAASLDEVRRLGSFVTTAGGVAVALFAHDDKVFAVENRCPHMGFPLHRGTVKDGVLTCHWHHARFDLETGGTFDQWADDARVFPVETRDGTVWVDVTQDGDQVDRFRERLRDGLERQLPLVIAKAVIGLDDAGLPPADALRIGLDFGTRYRAHGWGRGLTTLACMVNLIPCLAGDDRRRALYHGLADVAAESAGTAPRFPIRPLAVAVRDPAVFKRWFRRFVEVRDSEGAERCIASAVRAGATPVELADMLFAAATDHRYVTSGHLVDFTNKALEALDRAGWEHAELVLPSLAAGFASGERMEEANSWRHPVDVVALVEEAAEQLPGAATLGRSAATELGELVETVLGDDPHASVQAILTALQEGTDPTDVAGQVARAAALRIARFHTANEFSDWDTALHTFTFANAVQQGLRRTQSSELLRGILDAAMSIYLDRFLNVPPARLPEPDRSTDPAEQLLELPLLLDHQQHVNEAGSLVASYLAADGEASALLASLGSALLREDRNFHTIQMIEAAFRQWSDTGDSIFLVAGARYLAAHAPTVRAQEQTFTIASRLHRGERLYEEP